MIGTSPKSDINPALAAGLNAVFVPHAHTWAPERQEIEPGGGRLLVVERFADLEAFLRALGGVGARLHEGRVTGGILHLSLPRGARLGYRIGLWLSGGSELASIRRFVTVRRAFVARA